MRQQRGFKPYLTKEDRKNITKNTRYSENEYKRIREYISTNNLTYSAFVKEAIEQYFNRLK